ncbi:MAG: hypothetical protein ACRDTX_20105 [Pseudonocardiaceae bacterium]
MGAEQGLLTLEELRVLVDEQLVDTVLIGLTDMQGRLQGKRCAARTPPPVTSASAWFCCAVLS